MTLALLAFIVGVMVGALAGAFVVSLAVAARRGDDMAETARWQTDVTWEEHA